jgi:hypothetical protein
MGLRALMRRVVTVDEWGIGTTDLEPRDLICRTESAGSLSVTPTVRWLPKPWFARIQADPCLVEYQGRLFLYFEEVRVGSMTGGLRMTELPRTGAPPPRGVRMMSLEGHASYPYVFNHMDTFYCVPETGQSNRVSLYTSDAPWGPWRLERVLMDGVSARDSTIVCFDGSWWLFCTVDGADPRSAYADLYIWHAPDPRGPWAPHALRPAKTDIHSSRPAGRPFIAEGVLYRPAQDCSPTYGSRTVVNRVLTLTPLEFAEEVCALVEPDALGLYGKGLHTISAAGGLMVVDGCRSRTTLNPFKVATMVILRIRRRIRRRRVQGRSDCGTNSSIPSPDSSRE